MRQTAAVGRRRLALAIGGLAVLPLLLLGLIVVFGSEDRDKPAAVRGTYGTGLAGSGIPAQVVPWIERSAAQCDDLSAPLLAAQLSVASGFQPTARSATGTEGIAQLTPADWRTYGRDADGDGLADPFSVGDAVMAQGRYMCVLFRRVDGFPGDRTQLALAAYNAGIGNVAAYDGVPPFASTRSYIRSVLTAVATFTAADTGDVVFPLPPRSPWVDNDNWGSSGSHWSAIHTGDDFSVPCGTPVLAATGGTVVVDTSQGWAGTWLVEVSTGPGRLTTWYAHLQALTTKNGARVKAGQQIGNVGALGNATGCHLHFEYHPRGGTIYEDSTDPVPWLRSVGAYPRP